MSPKSAAPVTEAPPGQFYSTAALAALLCVSASKLNHDRVNDTKAIAAGRPSVGIPWIRLGAVVRYRSADVLAWLAANSTPCGVGAPVAVSK